MQAKPQYRRVKGGLMPEDMEQPLPKPKYGGGARKAIACAALAVLALSGISFWLTRPAAERANLRKEAASAVNEALASTPLAGIGNIIADAPPPPPPRVTNPPTEKGTLSGREVTGTIAAPMDFGPLLPGSGNPAGEQKSAASELTGGIAAGLKEAARDMADFLTAESAQGKRREEVVFSREYVEPVTEDSTVRPGYLAGLAQWLANHYRPGPDGGSIAASVRSLNHEGTRLAAQAGAGRGGLLRYAFHPGMIDGLYRLYIDRFMEDLDAAAAGKGMDANENRQFHAALGRRAALLAAGIEATLHVPDLAARLARIDDLARKAVDENTEMANAIFELDELKNAAPQQRAAARLRVDGAAARYRRAQSDHAAAQDELARAVRQYAGPGLDEDTLLYMAAWTARRDASGANARAALQSCVAVLRDLSARCAAQGGGNE